jgi:hypothetical protein
LPKENSSYDVNWFTWASINEDGTFVIASWPAGEDIQIIALCDGYMAESGQPPAVVKNPGRPDAYCRPQVFSPSAQPIVLSMTPTVRCIIETVDEQASPLAGVKVTSNPNVGWWNGGSQIYSEPLLRGECLLMKRDYQLCVDHSYSGAYSTVTGADGRAELELPAGRESLSAGSDNYELPVVQGRRRQSVTLTAGQTTTTRLVLQPKGTERLGDWDKLTGVLFGCTGEQCRRLLNDPSFRAKMENVRQLLNAAEDPTDPVLLTAAYLQVADAFEELEDKQEAAKWRIKAAQQAAKLMPTGKKEASVPKQ